MNESKFKVFSDGTKEWCFNGRLHREGGQPAVVYPDGSKAWYLNGELHRTDGPAIELAYGLKYWFLNGVKYETPNEMPLSLFLAYVKWMRDSERV